jgi:hypothetical protein
LQKLIKKAEAFTYVHASAFCFILHRLLQVWNVPHFLAIY